MVTREVGDGGKEERERERRKNITVTYDISLVVHSAMDEAAAAVNEQHWLRRTISDQPPEKFAPCAPYNAVKCKCLNDHAQRGDT